MFISGIYLPFLLITITITALLFYARLNEITEKEKLSKKGKRERICINGSFEYKYLL